MFLTTKFDLTFIQFYYGAEQLLESLISLKSSRISLNNSFDVVIAGDLIEHVNNVGIFLNNVRAHLKPSGVFLFNTPNAYSINFLLRGFFLFGNVKQFKEHIYLFNEDLINELMSRNGFKIKEVSYFTHHGSSISSLIIRFFSFFSKRWNENIMFRVVLEDD